jgi:hypothetical protein
MDAYDIDIVVGTYIDSTVNYSKVYRWDTIQTTWQFSENTKENGINCFFWIDKVMYAQCGQFGNIYHYSGKFLVYERKLPGTWNPSNTAEVYPSAQCNWQGGSLLGLSNISGNPADQAVYSIARYDSKYPIAFSEDFPISTGNLNNVLIGALLTVGKTLYVSWQDSNGGNTFGVDAIDYNNLYTAAYIETMAVNKEGLFKLTWARFWANVQSLPANTSLAFSYYANWGSKTATGNTAIADTSDLMQVYSDESVDARVIRMRIDFTVSGNNGPIVEAFGMVPANE